LFLVPLFLVWFRVFEWVSPRISLRETWMDVLCILGLILCPQTSGNHFDSRIFVRSSSFWWCSKDPRSPVI
jgi:hypothetical protein